MFGAVPTSVHQIYLHKDSNMNNSTSTILSFDNSFTSRPTLKHFNESRWNIFETIGIFLALPDHQIHFLTIFYNETRKILKTEGLPLESISS